MNSYCSISRIFVVAAVLSVGGANAMNQTNRLGIEIDANIIPSRETQSRMISTIPALGAAFAYSNGYGQVGNVCAQTALYSIKGSVTYKDMGKFLVANGIVRCCKSFAAKSECGQKLVAQLKDLKEKACNQVWDFRGKKALIAKASDLIEEAVIGLSSFAIIKLFAAQ